MELSEILKKVDHTLLKPEATTEQIIALCDDAVRFSTASVCIPPCYVKTAADYLKHAVAVCTVIGFPHGNMTTAAKVFETADAVENGADEIDMVINIGALKAGNIKYVEDDIRSVRAVCPGKILKVIIETCKLTDDEIALMCAVVSRAGADYIKTSTGFAEDGANRHVVEVMAANRPEGLKIKAAGGIKTIEDAADFINLGADRLGTSRLVAIAKTL